MRPVCTIPFVAAMIITGLSFSFSGSKRAIKQVEFKTGFAVVELFTSEGCSSCPAADEAVIELTKEYPSNVYILGFHVDYWNHIGWKDEYSSSAFTERQRQYAGKFNLNSIYTPQVVINGKKQFVGSDKNLLRSSVENELQKNGSSFIELKAEQESSNKISVTTKTSLTSESVLMIALVQLKAATAVRRGENKGVVLQHINIVRDIKTISVDKKVDNYLSFTIPKGLTAKELKVISFLQNKNNWNITGASEATIQ